MLGTSGSSIDHKVRRHSQTGRTFLPTVPHTNPACTMVRGRPQSAALQRFETHILGGDTVAVRNRLRIRCRAVVVVVLHHQLSLCATDGLTSPEIAGQTCKGSSEQLM